MGAALAAVAGCCALGAEGAYVRSDSYVGADFISRWTFWDDPDPTHGFVDYVDHATAGDAGLVQVAETHVYLGADMQTVVKGKTGRRSVRIQSKAVYNEGLFVLAVDHIPTGCGTWPAFWMYGEDDAHTWPRWGEYDIIEAVHTDTRAKTTLHTRQNCDQSSVHEGLDFTSSWALGSGPDPANNCYIGAEGWGQWFNQGCSQEGPQDTVGAGFNAGGGGTFTAEWNPVSRHIRTWFWPSGTEPPDLQDGEPDPDTWGKPYSFFSLDPVSCSKDHFENMRLVFDLTFCGDWAGATFAGACPQHNMTCDEFVAKHPEAMSEAYWSIRELSVYTQSAQAPTGSPTESPTESPTTPMAPKPSPAPPDDVAVVPVFGSARAPSPATATASAQATAATSTSAAVAAVLSLPPAAVTTTAESAPTTPSQPPVTTTSTSTSHPTVSVVLRDSAPSLRPTPAPATPEHPAVAVPEKRPGGGIPVNVGHTASSGDTRSRALTTVAVSVALLSMVAAVAIGFIWKMRRRRQAPRSRPALLRGGRTRRTTTARTPARTAARSSHAPHAPPRCRSGAAATGGRPGRHGGFRAALARARPRVGAGRRRRRPAAAEVPLWRGDHGRHAPPVPPSPSHRSAHPPPPAAAAPGDGARPTPSAPTLFRAISLLASRSSIIHLSLRPNRQALAIRFIIWSGAFGAAGLQNSDVVYALLLWLLLRVLPRCVRGPYGDYQGVRYVWTFDGAAHGLMASFAHLSLITRCSHHAPGPKWRTPTLHLCHVPASSASEFGHAHLITLAAELARMCCVPRV
ncbi:unnamed protein product [Prorocentrum cordatum]|uniref:GH16 domain-containing protein n=1 Tax=Prorocentrum cordatum TaxID=2364126 RepID=A0ABN9WYP6_9DINO|nr:unnamed protein product [Polarella glacialis]